MTNGKECRRRGRVAPALTSIFFLSRQEHTGEYLEDIRTCIFI